MKGHYFLYRVASASLAAAVAVSSVLAAPAPDECTNWQANQPTWIFCNGYESGDFSGWTTYAGPINNHVTTANPYTALYSMAIHYNKVYNPTDPTNSPDQNLFSMWDSPTQQDHVFVRGYVYFGQPLAGTEPIQRKLFYLWSPGPNGSNWSIILTTFNYSLTFDEQPPQDSAWSVSDTIASTNPGWLKVPVPDPNGVQHYLTFVPNRWYKVEMEVQDNTPGQHDGVLAAYVDDVLIQRKSTCNLRGNLTTGLFRFGIGYQADDSNMVGVNGMRYDEMRYWDNVVIAKGATRSVPGNPVNPVTTGSSGPAITAYPNPWRSDRHAGTGMTFTNLQPGSSLKLFTMSGHKVTELAVTGSSATWNLLNDSGKSAASGIYFFTATDQAGHSSRGKVGIIR